MSVAALDAIALVDGSAPGSIRFSRNAYRSGDPLTVHYLVAGSAVAGQDYAALPGVLVIPAGALEANGAVLDWPDAAGGTMVSAPSSGEAPTLVPNVLNGLPALHFDGLSQRLDLSDFLHDAPEAELFLVQRSSATGAAAGSHRFGTSSAPAAYPASGPLLEDFVATRRFSAPTRSRWTRGRRWLRRRRRSQPDGAESRHPERADGGRARRGEWRGRSGHHARAAPLELRRPVRDRISHRAAGGLRRLDGRRDARRGGAHVGRHGPAGRPA